MDDKTLLAYQENGKDFCKRYREIERISSDLLQEVFELGGSVLEIGVGSGADANKLMSAGFEVTGLEPSPELILQAENHFPELKGKIKNSQLPLRDELLRKWKWQQRFDGVLCSAVLMHIPKQSWMQALESLQKVLKPKGSLLISVSLTREGLDEHSRDEYGRLYVPIEPDELKLTLQEVGFDIVKKWTNADRWSRHGMVWETFWVQRP